MMLRRMLFYRPLMNVLLKVESPVQNLGKHNPWNSTSRNFCDKPNKTPSLHIVETDSSESKDPILTEIQNVTSHAEMLNIIKNNQNDMNNTHLSATFFALNKLTSSTSDKTIVSKIQADPDFHALCQRALKLMRHFTSDEITKLLASLCRLEVPLNCTLGQATLQMVRHYINDLSLSQIMFVHLLLSKQPSQPLVDALRKALPLALEVQLPYQLNPDNLKDVVGCLNMAVNCGLSVDTLERLGDILVHQALSLSKEQALSAVCSLSQLNPFPPSLKDAASEVLIKLTHFAQELNMNESERLILALRKCKQMRNIKLFKILTHKCVIEQWDLRCTCTLLSVVNFHQFLSTELLNWTVECLQKDPDLLRKDKRIPFKTTIEAFSEANHSIDREFFMSLVTCNEDILNDIEANAPDMLVTLVMHLAILECLPTKLLQRVFQVDLISKAVKNAAEKGRETNLLQCYLSLEQHARLEATASPVCYEGPFLPDELLKAAIEARATVMQPLDLVLQDFLETGLGGPQFMLSGLWTKMGHFIDHLVVMRKEDFPVTVDTRDPLKKVVDPSGLSFVEDLSLPEDAKMLAILVARQEWFNRDPPSLRGWTSFQQRTLAKMGYNPVIIGPPVQSKGQIQDIDCRMESESFA